MYFSHQQFLKMGRDSKNISWDFKITSAEEEVLMNRPSFIGINLLSNPFGILPGRPVALEDPIF